MRHMNSLLCSLGGGRVRRLRNTATTLILAGCGGSAITPPPSDGCFGSDPLISPAAAEIAVGDSIAVITGRGFAFAQCFPQVPFVIEWEATPAGQVLVRSDSDSSMIATAVSSGLTRIMARVASRPLLAAVMTITVR